MTSRLPSRFWRQLQAEPAAVELPSERSRTNVMTAEHNPTAGPRASPRPVSWLPRPLIKICCSPRCNTAAYFCALLVMLPHNQPFNATPLLISTVVLWWAWPMVLSAWLMVCAVQLIINGAARRAPLARASVVLFGAYVYYFQLDEHGPFNRFWYGETGFLRLCMDWCGSGWTPGTFAGPNDYWLLVANVPVQSYCYRAPDARFRNVSAPRARDFFRQHVFGAVSSTPQAWWDEPGVSVRVTSLEQPLRIVAPGRPTVLLAFKGEAEQLARATGWSVLRLSPGLTPDDERNQLPMMAVNAARANAVAALLRGWAGEGRAVGEERDGGEADLTESAPPHKLYESVVIYGCSAAVTAPPGLYKQAWIDSGGALGPSSVKVVGPCGESWEAMVRRWPQWVAPDAATLEAPALWPADVGDLMLDVCHTTRFSFGVGRYNQWNNFEGTMETVRMAQAAGCHVNVHEGHVAHCGYFLEGTCAHSC